MRGDTTSSQRETLAHYADLIRASPAFRNVRVIGVTGSVARGEKELGQASLNDIDFFVVADSYDPTGKTEIERKLRKHSRTVFTDILFLRASFLKRTVRQHRIDQYLFDLIDSPVILYSDDEFSAVLTRLARQEFTIRKRSATTVLFTRLWCLTGPYIVEGRTIKPLDADLTSYQMSKAISAIIDAALIQENLYKTSSSDKKLDDFRQTRFYRAHAVNIDLLISFLQGTRLNTMEVYQALIVAYLSIMYTIVGRRLPSYLSFPVKRCLILSIFSTRRRRYIERIVRRWSVLNQIEQFYRGGDEKSLEKLALSFSQIYSEAMA